MLASVKALLSSIVDYAGLFPPAKLSLPEAMATYAQDQMAAYHWMLGQFVLPASRLNEFVALLPTFPLKQWSLSAILSGELELELKRLNPSIRTRSPLQLWNFRRFCPLKSSTYCLIYLLELMLFLKFP